MLYFLKSLGLGLNYRYEPKGKVGNSIKITYLFSGCGGRIWTNDLRVMSPTSYQLLYPAIFSCFLKSSYIIARWGYNVKCFLQKKRARPILQPKCRFLLTKTERVVKICKGSNKELLIWSRNESSCMMRGGRRSTSADASARTGNGWRGMTVIERLGGCCHGYCGSSERKQKTESTL